jgi:leucyl-tRNA synthetase
MKLTNAINALKLEDIRTPVLYEAISVLIRLLAPFSPHLADEFWLQIGGQSSVHQQKWPNLDTSALVRDTVELVIQVKGKVRGSINVPANAEKETLEQLALASDIAQKWLEGNSPRRVIVVPGKLVNLVP